MPTSRDWPFSPVPHNRSLSTPVPAGVLWHPIITESLANLPGGQQRLWGVPFLLAEADDPERWLWPGTKPVTVVLQGSAAWLVIAHFCGASRSPRPEADGTDLPLGMVQDPGVRLADYVLVFEDGTEHRQPIRRRFEINDVLVIWGQLAFGARPHRRSGATDWRGPHGRGEWGRNQMATEMPVYEADMEPWPHRRAVGNYWLYALPNPRPEAPLAAVRLESAGVEHVAVAGLTLCHGVGHPLRYSRLETLRIQLPHPQPADEVPIEVDLGVIGRRYSLPPFDADAWLTAAVAGWGSPSPAATEPNADVLVEVSASDSATLTVAGTALSFAAALAGELAPATAVPRVEVVASERTWIHVTIVDSATGRPTPCRVHIRSPLAGYLPPYGHRREVNDGWFEDYGADLKLGQTAYAYVNGSFQIEVPIGDVYIEVVKGFEYRPLRTRVTIRPGQREVRLELQRGLDWRRQGWVTADTHVHFLSPETAWLEAQAEGLNIVNLLAAQWGDLYTNVGDFTGALSGVSRDDTLIWVGTEHRQHLLGHISLLGTRGDLIVPLSASGPEESYLGDPTWAGLTDWADACRERDGLVIVPHFPNPLAESVADVILGKVDALELRDFHWGVDSEGVRMWYRFLNCGYRVGAVGGTDKMSAAMPVGGVRTFAHIGGRPLSFDAWAEAVRHGRTFSSSGPLLELSVDGQPPGAEIRLGQSAALVEVEARAVCLHPIHRLELVHDGQVVAEEHSPEGSRELRLRARLPVKRSGWVAARCVGEHRLWHGWPVVLAAHSSPVYLTIPAKPAFNTTDARHLNALLEGGETWIDSLAITPDPALAVRLKSVFGRARAALISRQVSDG